MCVVSADLVTKRDDARDAGKHCSVQDFAWCDDVGKNEM